MLENKIIAVTGGNGLLGKEIIRQIQNKGGTALNLDITNQTDAAQHLFQCDVTNPASVKDTIQLIHATYSRIDGLVNCSYPRTKDWGKKLESVTYESWQQNVDMQMNSVFNICQVVGEIMKQQQQGVIINMSSIYGVVGPDFSLYDGTEMTVAAPYAAIKGGLVNFTRYLASYWGAFNVRVNCISPGGIFDNQLPSFVAAYEKKVPLKRMGKPGDIAPAVCFLLSDDASYITGHNLMIDGGWTAI